MPTGNGALPVGVVGVGSMGRQHARVYSALPSARLVGVSDVDDERAREVAREYGATALSVERLLESAAAVSVATPDGFHYDIARRALDAGVAALVEKPFVTDPAEGRDLVERARAADLPLAVGHVERFNPAVETLPAVLAEEDVVALAADRLGPPLDRATTGGVVRDLMIHDVDVVLSVIEEPVVEVSAARARAAPYVTAVLTFASGTTARLTASRATQRKVRRLSVTADDATVEVDYLDQSVEVHRRSVPGYVASDGDLRYRHEGVVERPTVDQREPLHAELSSFVDAVHEGATPAVTGEDGLAALSVVERIEAALEEPAAGEAATPEEVSR